jgi:hypothetical protein
MVNLPGHCWSKSARPREPGRIGALALAVLASTAACSHAEPPVAAQSRADVPAAPLSDSASPVPLPPGVLCPPAARGSLRARLQGAVDADLDWDGREPQCRGGIRPEGDGLRLVYRGTASDGGPLLLVIGAGPLRPGESARNVPVNLTVVREGTGEFFATQGDDKCAFDEVRQSRLVPSSADWLLEGRGYCTQPARAVGGAGAVLVSRFDVVAVVDGGPATAPAAAGTARPAP